jgi:hypothetical protein
MSSKRRIRNKQCVGKVRHDSKEAAHAALGKTFNGSVRGLHLYHCRFCNGWHVGHKRVKRPSRRKDYV